MRLAYTIGPIIRQIVDCTAVLHQWLHEYCPLKRQLSLASRQPNVANILLFNLCEQIFVQHGPITIAIDCNGLSLLIFEEK